MLTSNTEENWINIKATVKYTTINGEYKQRCWYWKLKIWNEKVKKVENKRVYNIHGVQQDRKGILLGVYSHSKGVLHNTSHVIVALLPEAVVEPCIILELT